MNIEPISAFSDNYIWLAPLDSSGSKPTCLVVDPGEAAPVLQALAQKQWELTAILITHHHFDHTGGVQELRKAYPNVKTYGPVPGPFQGVDHKLTEKDELSLGPFQFEIIEVPGHTLDHIAFYDRQQDILFCGDTLFSAGCGRIFEGTPSMMLNSLEKLKALPPTTKIFCTHEYTMSNLKFALEVEPNNQELLSYFSQCKDKRKQQLPTLPTTMHEQLQVNPFLRSEHPTVRTSAVNFAREQGLSQPLQTNDIFATVRAWKDQF